MSCPILCGGGIYVYDGSLEAGRVFCSEEVSMGLGRAGAVLQGLFWMVWGDDEEQAEGVGLGYPKYHQ